jgi:hypothetical protein
MNKLHYDFEDIIKIYAEALEHETGMDVNLRNAFDYDSYELTYDSSADKITVKIKGASIQFEMEDADVYVVNYGNGSGWQFRTLDTIPI